MILLFAKHQNKAEFDNMDDSEVLSSDFWGFRTSAASLAWTNSLASTTLKPLEPTRHHNSRKLLILLPLRAI